MLPICVGSGENRKSAMAEFVILRDSTTYNVILERRTINELSAVICTKLLTMKFVTNRGVVRSIRIDLKMAVTCDNASLSLRKKSKKAAGVFLKDLDARVDDKLRLDPQGDLEKFQVEDAEDKFTFVNRNLPQELKKPRIETVRANSDLFTWTPADMPGVDLDFMSHRLAMKSDAKPVAQRRRKMSPERANEVVRQTASLLEASFIRELKYSTWLSNVILVKKANAKWRMCVDYSDLNKACPKNSFPLTNIDALVDAVAGYRFLNFIDAYSGYNQILMHHPDKEKMTFITPTGTYCYKVIQFGLKNAGATYQRLMSKVFKELIGKSVEVNVNDMLVKIAEPSNLVANLEFVFRLLWKHNMRLNPLKCVFAMEAGKFSDSMIM
ncbi:transposon Ty3-I Gag-Pol polyprotein isoform X1 [Arachis hypogaea]|uniref:transposon Ty3-I Gag-Pol polyprotein isoform X1 n=1 Tax=Arachis hypogaea TaxID=3818 RepID=UPI0011056E7F|nr:uncharacterized protein LOC112742032 isoform X1 [Arachis hypogaea]